MERYYLVVITQIVDGRESPSNWIHSAVSAEDARQWAEERVQEFNTMSDRIGCVHTQRVESVAPYTF
jgi:hypothetical protein